MSRHRRSQPRLNVVSLYWSLWIFGTVLIILSWIRVAHPLVGWIGFFIAGVATVTSIIFNLFMRQKRRGVPVAASARPIGVTFDEGSIQLRLADGRIISAPLTWYPKLEQASPEERTRYEFDDNGLYWPELDVDVSIADVLDGTRPTGYTSNHPPHT